MGQRTAPPQPGNIREGFLEEAWHQPRGEGKVGIHRVTGGVDGAGSVVERTACAKSGRQRKQGQLERQKEGGRNGKILEG